jgi:hypothetical protein
MPKELRGAVRRRRRAHPTRCGSDAVCPGATPASRHCGFGFRSCGEAHVRRLDLQLQTAGRARRHGDHGPPLPHPPQPGLDLRARARRGPPADELSGRVDFPLPLATARWPPLPVGVGGMECPAIPVARDRAGRAGRRRSEEPVASARPSSDVPDAAVESHVSPPRAFHGQVLSGSELSESPLCGARR